jgi:predicted outer membrane repeat protein
MKMKYTSKTISNGKLSGIKSIIGLVVLLLLIVDSSTAQIFVKQGATGSGTTWDNATGTIPTGVLAANTKIYIAAGNYTINALTTLEQDGILIQGGFPTTATGTSLSGYNPLGNATRLTRVGSGGFYSEGSTNTADKDNKIEVKGIIFTGATGNGGLFALSTGHGNYTFTDVTAHGMTVTNGVIYLTTFNNGSVNVINCNFYENTATADGGAIYHSTENNNAKLVISNSVFSNNKADHGGALYITSINESFDAVSIDKSSFCGNSSQLYGGAIYQTSSRIKINASTFSNNTCPEGYYGGAIFATTAQLTITGSGFYNNKGGAGGAIYSTTAFSGNINTVSESVFYGNEATDPTGDNAGTNGGGAMCLNANANEWTITSCKFASNKVPAAGWGGAIANYDLETSLDNCVFFNNQKGGNANISGSDIKNYNNAGGFFSITNSKMQLASAPIYTNQTGGSTDASSYGFSGTNNLFSNTDNGGVADPGFSCPTTIAFNYSIQGKIFDDHNGLNDGMVNGVTTNLPSYLKVTLMSGATQLQTVTAIDGAFAFNDVAPGSYKLVLNLTVTLRALNVDWVTTGEFVGAGTGSDGTPDGNLDVTVLDRDVNNANFGINKAPVAHDVAVSIRTPVANSSIILDGTAGNPTAPNGTDNEDLTLGSGSTIVFTTLPINGELYYNGALVTANQPITAFNPSLLSLKFTGSGYTSSIFKYAFIDNASTQGTEAAYTITLSGPLPVILVSFKAVKENSTVSLTWTTTSENNSDRFEIERSGNAKEWTVIGQVAAAGESKSQVFYSKTDAVPLSGVNYYRLKMIDMDATFAYSMIKKVELPTTTIRLYPNPVSDELTVDTNSLRLSNVKLLNARGMTVYDSGASIPDKINVRNLVAGMYIVRFEHSDGTFPTQKIMIIR